MKTGNAITLERAEAAHESAPRTALHPNVLLVRWEIALRACDWSSAVAIAKALIAAMPAEPIGWIYHAFAQQQLGQLHEARQCLLAAARKFPTDWRLAYNLACYTAQLGDVAGAWNWLENAFELGDAAIIKSLAAEEESLMPLWEKAGLKPETDFQQPAPARQMKIVPVAFAA
jgi:Flp pilus assembly protein TadD